MFKQKVGVHKSCVIWSLCLKNLQSYVVTIILFLNLELWCNIFVIITKMAQLAAHSGVHILWVMKPLQKSPRHILLLFSWVYCVKIFIHVECCDDHKIGWLVVLSVSYKRKVTGYYRSFTSSWLCLGVHKVSKVDIVQHGSDGLCFNPDVVLNKDMVLIRCLHWARCIWFN